MLTGKIDFTGKTFSDVEYAVEEALSLIRGEFTSGFNHNDTGSFTFEITGEEEAATP